MQFSESFKAIRLKSCLERFLHHLTSTFFNFIQMLNNNSSLKTIAGMSMIANI